MKKVIALKGTEKTGKSQTIMRVYRLLVGRYPDAPHEFASIGRVDVRVELVINGKRVGIEGQGDPDSRLFESLQQFREHGCDVIVCATRTRGATVDAVRELSPEYDLVWLDQEPAPPQQREAWNREMAARITDMVTGTLAQ